MRVSEEWMLEQATEMAYSALRDFEWMSVFEMLDGIPEWDALMAKAEETEDYTYTDEIGGKIFEMIQQADVSIPTMEQRYKET